MEFTKVHLMASQRAFLHCYTRNGKPAEQMVPWVEGDHMQPGGVFISYPGVYEVNEEPNDLETVRGSAGW